MYYLVTGIALCSPVDGVVRDAAAPVRDLDDEVLLVAGYDDVDGGQLVALHPRVGLDGRPHRVLQQLGQNVVQRHLNVGEVSSGVARDLDGGTVAVPGQSEISIVVT